MAGTVMLLAIIVTFVVAFNWPVIKAAVKKWFADESARIRTVTGVI